jgi:hypothetical protein
MRRMRFKKFLSHDDRLEPFPSRLKDAASKLPPGPEQDAMFKRACVADTASNINRWANSPGLRPPR